MTGEPLALYVHWPFCVSKCPYCDFNSHVRATVDERAWRDALLADLQVGTLGPKILAVDGDLHGEKNRTRQGDGARGGTAPQAVLHREK